MKSEFLKIAGVKSEAEFYKKFPSEEAFMKKHGKAVKKFITKKAQVGTIVPNIQSPTSNIKPIRIDEEFLYNNVADLTGKESYDDMMKRLRSEEMLKAIKSGQSQKSSQGDMMSTLSMAKNKLGELGSNSNVQSASAKAIGAVSSKNGGKFSPHVMYNPKTGKGKKAKTYKEHLALKKKGWGHEAPKAQIGYATSGITPVGIDTPNTVGIDTPNIVDVNPTMTEIPNNQFDFMGTAQDIYEVGAPIVGDIMQISDQFKAQKQQLAQAKQNKQLSELALQASKTTPEKIERQYVRPEDFSYTGETMFPVQGVGTTAISKQGGMYSAKGGGNFLNMFNVGGPRNLNLKGNDLLGKGEFTYFQPYYENMQEKLEHNRMLNRKRVNSMSALENGGYVKAEHGGMFTGEYMPIVDPNQQKQFKGGGFVYGGGQAGAAGTNFARMFGADSDAGSNVGSKIGGTLGTLVGGPVGGAIGGALGTIAGGLLDTTDKKIDRQEELTKRYTDEMAFASVAPAVQANYASYLKNGGELNSYKNGGSRISTNPSMLDTMKMGGELKTLWGGEAETVSYNPYAGGESIEFNGNSHNNRDPKTGQTGIGVAYGKDAVNNNQASVEVENEPAQKLRDGGGDENLVVYGDMKIPEEYVAEINDDRAKGKKFKGYVSNVLNKDEAKINKRMEKVSELGLESNDTVFGQLERNTADVVLKGSDMKLKSIADKKNILADLQNAMNETFDQYGIDANKFIQKGEMIEDPMRIENSKMAKYGKDIPKAQEGITGNVKKDDFNKKPIPKTDKTPEKLLEEGYIQDKSNPKVYIKTEGDAKEAVELSIKALEKVPGGQSKDEETGLYGKVTQEEFETAKAANPWFDWENFNPNNEADVERYQKEFNKRAEESGDSTRIKVDKKFGEQTASARFTPAEEGSIPTQSRVVVGDLETTTETEPVDSKPVFPYVNFQRPIDDVPLDSNQLLGEYYALATNQVQPVQAQGFQPNLRVPYDISLQSAKNDIIAQSRALQRNPVLENNPAALALAQAPTYEALNKINEFEFIQNQRMKDNIYSSNLDTINKARMMNLGIFDKQADRQAEATSKTRTQNIDILSSISNKYSQNKRDNAIRKVYANMYPTFRFNENYQTEVQQPAMFNIPGQGSTGYSPLNVLNPTLQNKANVLGQISQQFKKKKESTEEEEEDSNSAKYGKKITKNNKNSNILKAIRNL
jgi:hypothetical protein